MAKEIVQGIMEYISNEVNPNELAPFEVLTRAEMSINEKCTKKPLGTQSLKTIDYYSLTEAEQKYIDGLKTIKSNSFDFLNRLPNSVDSSFIIETSGGSYYVNSMGYDFVLYSCLIEKKKKQEPKQSKVAKDVEGKKAKQDVSKITKHGNIHDNKHEPKVEGRVPKKPTDDKETDLIKSLKEARWVVYDESESQILKDENGNPKVFWDKSEARQYANENTKDKKYRLINMAANEDKANENFSVPCSSSEDAEDILKNKGVAYDTTENEGNEIHFISNDDTVAVFNKDDQTLSVLESKKKIKEGSAPSDFSNEQIKKLKPYKPEVVQFDYREESEANKWYEEQEYDKDRVVYTTDLYQDDSLYMISFAKELPEELANELQLVRQEVEPYEETDTSEYEEDMDESKIKELAEKLVLVEYFKKKKSISSNENKFVKSVERIKLSNKVREKVEKKYKEIKDEG